MPAPNKEMLFRRLQPPFRLGGVPRRGIHDSMRTAIDSIGRGKDRQINVRFPAMTSHYLFKAEFCNPASGRSSMPELWQRIRRGLRPERSKTSGLRKLSP